MWKKIALPVVLALLLGLALTGIALASESEDTPLPPEMRRGVGQIAALGESQITLRDLRQELVTLEVDEDTVFKSTSGEPASFADLETGQWLAVAAVAGEGVSRLARLVILLPEDYQPPKPWVLWLRGRVEQVDALNGSFDLQPRRGEELTLVVDADTRFQGQVDSLEGLTDGMLAEAAILRLEDGTFLALAVRTHSPLVWHAGTISGVDPAAGSIILETRRGDVITITATDETRFRSRGGWVQAVEDLEVGMLILVGADETADGQYQARLVLVGRPHRP